MTEILSREPSGRQLADTGIALAHDRADNEIDGWSDRIMAAFESWLQGQDGRFAVEDFRSHIERCLPELVPPSHQAWGAVGRMARTRGLVRFVGYRPARSRATRNHPVRVFVRAV